MTDGVFNIITASAAVLGLLGGAFGFFWARYAKAQSAESDKAAADAQLKATAALEVAASASVKAADAASDAAAALAKSSNAQERMADAIEAISRRSASSSPRPAGYPSRFETRGSVDTGQPTPSEAYDAAKQSAIVQLFSSLVGRDPVEWQVEPRYGAPNNFRLRNVGDVDANDVRVAGHPNQLASFVTLLGGMSLVAAVPGGAHLIVVADDRLMFTTRKIRVTWNEGDQKTPHEKVIQLP